MLMNRIILFEIFKITLLEKMNHYLFLNMPENSASFIEMFSKDAYNDFVLFYGFLILTFIGFINL